MAHILVVDDDEGVRSFLCDALGLAGHQAEPARDGREALDRLRRRAYPLVITDLRMPGLDGLGLVDRVRAEHPDTEIIVLSAHGTVDAAVAAMKRGVFDFLQKPLPDPDALIAVAERALERHQLRAQREGGRAEAPPLSWGAPAMAPVLRAVQKVAPTEATVLLLGESGTGKEVTARAIHARSARADGPFAAVNCAALSETLLESELFGHEKGAYTGAAARRRGRIELAAGGTFFLDEVGELKPDLQARLLRVLQERRFERVGGEQTVEADVRWIAATNRDLMAMAREGRFREDLYYRLAVFPITLPPLRERREDIGPLADALLARVSAGLGRPGLRLSPAARAALVALPWRGNVRELQNTLERAAILADGEVLDADAFGVAPPPEAGSISEAERLAIARALEQHGGNRRKAADQLGIAERTLYDKLKRYGLG